MIMTNPNDRAFQRKQQRGVVLFVALILLLILSLIGVTAARIQTSEERMARNEDNQQIGQQAAEAALRSAESNLATSQPGYVFPSSSPGMYTPTWSNGSPVSSVVWSDPTQVKTYSGPALTQLPTASQTPKLMIENLPAVAKAGSSLAVTSLTPTSNPTTVYRITAQGVGADGTSTTTLQSIYQQP